MNIDQEITLLLEIASLDALHYSQRMDSIKLLFPTGKTCFAVLTLNSNKINVIELELLDTKIKELDLGNSVLDIAKIVDDEKYKQGLDQFTPQLINGLRNSAMEDKARDLLFRVRIDQLC